MIGAIIGDIAGSVYEFDNHRSKEFVLFDKECFVTDDTIMTLAVAKALKSGYLTMQQLSQQAVSYMQRLGRLYPYSGYGARFSQWLESDNAQPYNSFGNGAAMRVSAVGFAANTIEQAKAMSRAVTEVSHNHPEGIKGAEAVAVAILLARQGKSKAELEDYIGWNYYDIDFTLDEIRQGNIFDESCMVTVPQAFQAFFESNSFEDTIRNAISIGGDSDTIAAIAGSIAEAYYGVPKAMEQEALLYMDNRLLKIYLSCSDFNKIC